MVLGIKKEITFRNIFNGTDILRSSGNQFNGKNVLGILKGEEILGMFNG